MTENCKLVFEVENLNNASPATVSRCGIVYVSETDLNWEPLCVTWRKDRFEKKTHVNVDENSIMEELFAKYIERPKLFEMLTKSFTYVMYTPPVIRITQLLNLVTVLFTPYVQAGETLSKDIIERFFVYSLAWSIGGLFETEEREKFHKYLESKGAPLPQISGQKMSVDKETVFDYYVDAKSKEWKLWEAEEWQPPKRLAFSQLLIPTIDSTRAEFLIQKIGSLETMKSEKRKEPNQQNVLLVGGAGTAKTSVVLMYSMKFD